MYPVGLPLRTRIRPSLGIVIHNKRIVGLRPSLFYRDTPPPAVIRPAHRVRRLANLYRNLSRNRRPNHKLMHRSRQPPHPRAPAALLENPSTTSSSISRLPPQLLRSNDSSIAP